MIYSYFIFGGYKLPMLSFISSQFVRVAFLVHNTMENKGTWRYGEVIWFEWLVLPWKKFQTSLFWSQFIHWHCAIGSYFRRSLLTERVSIWSVGDAKERIMTSRWTHRVDFFRRETWKWRWLLHVLIMYISLRIKDLDIHLIMTIINRWSMEGCRMLAVVSIGGKRGLILAVEKRWLLMREHDGSFIWSLHSGNEYLLGNSP